MSDPGTESGSVRTARRVADILALMAASDQPLTLAEVFRELGIPRSSAHALLKELVSTRLVERVDGRGPPTYRIAVRCFEIGSAFLRQRNLGEEARSVVERLSSAVDDTAHLAIMDGTDVMYVAKSESSQSMRLVSALGARLPAQATAVGRVLMSHMTDEELDDLLPDSFPRLTPNTITTRTELMTSIRETRAVDWAFDDEESTPGLQCLAVPVFDHTERCVAARSVSLPKLRMEAWDREKLLDLVRAHGADLSTSLGSRAAVKRLSSP